MLKEIREKKGLSQSQLAKCSGVNFRTIQNYEQGAKDIKKAQIQTVHKLAKALDCDVLEIAGLK